VGRIRCGLDQLDQHAAARLGVDEVDPAARRSDLRRVVKQPHALLAQRGTYRVDVGHAVRHLLDPRTLLNQERRDRRLRRQRRQQLDRGLRGVGGTQHRLAHALLDVLLDVVARHPERVLVERDGRVEVLDGDADVVDSGEKRLAREGIRHSGQSDRTSPPLWTRRRRRNRADRDFTYLVTRGCTVCGLTIRTATSKIVNLSELALSSDWFPSTWL
jgi:hypothetical protein